MAELRSSDVLAKQVQANKLLETRITDLETYITDLETRFTQLKQDLRWRAKTNDIEWNYPDEDFTDGGPYSINWEDILVSYVNNKYMSFSMWLKIGGTNDLYSLTRMEIGASSRVYLYFNDIEIVIDTDNKRYETGANSWPNNAIKNCKLTVVYWF